MSMLRGERRASDALVGVGRLLDADFLVGRLAGAAADADEPEEARGEAKGDGEPDDGKHLLAHGGVDVVGFEDGFEDAGEGGVDGCGGRGCGDDEDCLGLRMMISMVTLIDRTVWCVMTYSRNNRSNQTSPPRKDGKEANHKLRRAQNQRNPKTPHHPARHLLIRVQALLQILAQYLLRRRVLEFPHAEGIEPELGRRFGAVGNRLFAILILVAFAVRPETDLVKILEFLGGRGALEGFEELRVGLDVVWKVVEDVVWVGVEGACVGLKS
jgi:hypothetical protein